MTKCGYIQKKFACSNMLETKYILHLHRYRYRYRYRYTYRLLFLYSSFYTSLFTHIRTLSKNQIQSRPKITDSVLLFVPWSSRNLDISYTCLNGFTHVTLSVLPIDLYWRALCHLEILICFKTNSMPYWSTKTYSSHLNFKADWFLISLYYYVAMDD